MRLPQILILFAVCGIFINAETNIQLEIDQESKFLQQQKTQIITGQDVGSSLNQQVFLIYNAYNDDTNDRIANWGGDDAGCGMYNGPLIADQYWQLVWDDLRQAYQIVNLQTKWRLYLNSNNQVDCTNGGYSNDQYFHLESLTVQSAFGPKLHYIIKNFEKNAVIGGYPPAPSGKSGRGTLFGSNTDSLYGNLLWIAVPAYKSSSSWNLIYDNCNAGSKDSIFSRSITRGISQTVTKTAGFSVSMTNSVTASVGIELEEVGKIGGDTKREITSSISGSWSDALNSKFEVKDTQTFTVASHKHLTIRQLVFQTKENISGVQFDINTYYIQQTETDC